jgi:protein-S-isoprenylcysteine O-methyltransferase Ste14
MMSASTPQAQVRSHAETRRWDIGRIVVVPLAATLVVFDALSLLTGTPGGLTPTGSLRLLGTALVCVFYGLITISYLRRGPAVATSSSLKSHLAAVAGTFTPFAFPLLPSAGPGTVRELIAYAVLAAGMAWSVWSIRCLGRSLSILAQAREVVEHGPYRWIRHPLYTGELLSALGLALLAGTIPAAAVWIALCALQTYRARCEEEVLLRALPGYGAYRERTAALVPGLL